MERIAVNHDTWQRKRTVGQVSTLFVELHDHTESDREGRAERCKSAHSASVALSHEAANSPSKRLRAQYLPFTRMVQESGGLLPVVEGEEFYVVQPIEHGTLCRAPTSSSNGENRCAIADEMLGDVGLWYHRCTKNMRGLSLQLISVRSMFELRLRVKIGRQSNPC